MTIREMCERALATAIAKGFVDAEPRIDQKLLLAVGELVEAQNELRTGHTATEIYSADPYPYSHPTKPEGFPIELADAVIRIGQLAAELGIDLETAITEKMAYNDTRPHKHGGKKF